MIVCKPLYQQATETVATTVSLIMRDCGMPTDWLAMEIKKAYSSTVSRGHYTFRCTHALYTLSRALDL